MNLQKIDKNQYRSRLNMISVVTIAVLIVFALVYAQILIQLFADRESSNFKFNLIGVILAVASVVIAFNFIKSHPYLTEVMYVWDLKQINNKIYRKLHHIKAAAKENNVNALIVLHYYYQASQQLYTLDNNTLTLDTLLTDIANLEKQAAANNLVINIEDFQLTLLKEF